MKSNYTWLILMLFSITAVLAQEKTVSGNISDASGLPLPGVNVIIKGTSNGTQSDFDGNYTLQANNGQTIVFSYVGFKTDEAVVGANNNINIVMQEDAAVLEEVVITGYGNRGKDVLVSAVSLVTSEEISQLVSTTSVDNMLQGKAAGVQVTAANGKPGATAFVRVRGTTSLTAGASSPLYIIDGAPIDEEDLNAISNNEIESISILKDAATTSQYGSRGANGVVVITTKKGTKNKDAVIKLSSRYGVTSKIKDNYTMMNTTQKLQYERELFLLGAGSGNSPGVISTLEERQFLINNSIDWEDRILKEGTIQSNSFSISGGEEKSDYYFSVGHDRNTGIIQDVSGFERINARLNTNFEVKSWLDMGASVAYSRALSDEPRDRNNVQNPFRAYYDYNPYEPEFILDENGNTELDDNGDPLWNFNHTGFLVTEAIATTPEIEIQNITFINTYAKVKFNDNWNFRTQFSLNHENYRREYYVEPGNRLDFFVGDPNFPGIKSDNGFQEVDYTMSNTLNYSYSNDVHSLNVSALYEYNFNEFNSYTLRGRGFASSELTTQINAAEVVSASTGRNRITLVSYGAFANYDYKQRYIIGGSIRTDGSSNFGADHQFGTFYSGSVGWNVAKEEFFNVDWINTMKFRASYGTVGNRGSLGPYGPQGTVGFGNPYPGGSTTSNVNSPNENLKWESTAIVDVGLELGLFNNRVTAVVDYYRKETTDLLFQVPAADESGIPGFAINSNLGKIENKGWEFELNADIIRTPDLKWTVGGNISFLENKILELPDNDGDGIGDDIEPGDAFNLIFREGEAINAFFLLRYDGVDPETGRPLYLDADGNSMFLDELPEGENRVLLDKSPIAKFEGGFFSTISYKGFGLRTDFVYKSGNWINNFVQSNLLSDGLSIADNQAVGAFNYWKQPGDTGVLPSPIYGIEAQQSSDRFLQKGDFVRLRNITLSYNVPKLFLEKTPINSIRIYAQGQNLLTFGSSFFGDPEVGISSGETISQGNAIAPGEATLYSYPTTKSYTFGVDISF
jgi:TonB-linked SusC/RagA family outer membrane protein